MRPDPLAFCTGCEHFGREHYSTAHGPTTPCHKQVRETERREYGSYSTRVTVGYHRCTCRGFVPEKESKR
jgi:hypothetical protein